MRSRRPPAGSEVRCGGRLARGLGAQRAAGVETCSAGCAGRVPLAATCATLCTSPTT